jgi:uncharacterized protein HemY
MNSGNLQPQFDAHQSSLDLEGLDELLTGVVEPPIADGETAVSPESETAMIMLLLEQIRLLNDHVCEAKERLISANERMASLATVVGLQTRKLESLPHYEAEAAKISGLERNIILLERENEMLRQPWWTRLLRFITK